MKSIVFTAKNSTSERKGRFSEGILWDYNEIAQQMDRSGDICGAHDWIQYNIALTEDIYGVNGEGFSILVFDTSEIDRETTSFDDDPDAYLLLHPKLLLWHFSDFAVIENPET